MSATDQTSAADHRAAAAKAEAEKEASFQRSDTDGFLSQWASGLTAQLEIRKAEIVEAGGTAAFRVLCDADLTPVPAVEIKTRFGYRWAVFASAKDANSFGADIVEWIGTSAKAAARKGYRIGLQQREAQAFMDGQGFGMSGTAWVATKPADGVRFNPDAPVTEFVEDE